jgi:hypothetical protein
MLYWGCWATRWRLMLSTLIVLLNQVWLGGIEASELAEHMDDLRMIRVEERIDAPDFTLLTTDGNPVRLSDFKGHPVLLNFWASW